MGKNISKSMTWQMQQRLQAQSNAHRAVPAVKYTFPASVGAAQGVHTASRRLSHRRSGGAAQRQGSQLLHSSKVLQAGQDPTYTAVAGVATIDSSVRAH
jgi:hypothetical protein